MIWQRISAHRRLVVRNGGRWTSRPVPSARNRRSSTGLTATVIREPGPAWWEASVTVAVLRAHEVRGDTGAMVSRLAALAETEGEDLLVVVGTSAMRADHHAVLAGLRSRLPLLRVVELPVRPGAERSRESAMAAERLLADGKLPVVVTPGTVLHTITAEISSYLRADRVLRVLRTASGTALHEVWSRRPDPILN